MAKAGDMRSVQAELKRVFLGWDQPVLHSACNYLEGRFLKAGQWDMDQVLIVIPSSWAGRRLGELLADRAQRNGWLLRPPEIVTVGTLPEKLYQARFPFASDLVQVLCWTKVLREFDTEQLMPLLIDVPSREVLQPWVDLAGMLSGLHRELATDLLLFSDVADRLSGTQEEARWRVLQKLQRKYLDELDRHKLWDIQTARRVAIDRGEPQTNQQIIVVGAVDLNRAQRRFLDAVADKVTALIGAPENWSDGFDPHGALIPEHWQDLQVTVDPRCLHVRGTAVEAAAEAVRQLAYLPEPTSTVHVTVGVPDVELIPLLAEQFDRCHLKARYGAGAPVTQSPPMKMLSAITEYLDKGDFGSFAALIRLPAVSRMLRQQSELAIDYLQHVDDYYNSTLLRSINAAVWPEAPSREVVQGIVAKIEEWLKPLRSPSQSLADWSGPLLQVLQATYQSTTLNLDLPEDSALWEACSQLTDAISRLDDVPVALQVPVSVTEAIAWVHRFLEKERIPPPADPSAIELLGWLELALDDADVLVLTGIHDGMVPESINADAFLPNELRKQLGLMDNSRRYARDSYVLQTILHARKYLAIVLNNLNTEGDPLIPSRLLLAVPTEELGPRVQYLLKGEREATVHRVAGRWKPKPGQSNLPIPKPTPVNISKAIPVTDFRRYKECPYRYYLSQVMRLKPMDDLKVELEANDFGNLIHDCVAKIKDSPVATSIDENAIREWLLKEVDQLAKDRYGISPPVAVQIQLEQAKQRLSAFAMIQAQRAADGWVIQEVEFGVSSEKPVEFETSHGTVLIYGRMDRIDYSSTRKAWGIWDYKTGDSSNQPLKAHFTKVAGWKDFQLPLYRKLGAKAKIPSNAEVELGYIQIPKSAAETKFDTAEFEATQLSEAYEQVGKIYSAIQSQTFWPPKPDYDSPWDAFGAICQTNVARPWDEQTAMAEVQDQQRSQEATATSGSVKDRGEVSREQQTGTKAVTKTSTSMVLPQLIERAKRKVDTKPVSLKLEPMVLEGEIPPNWFSPLVIRASAGTGKTYQLAVRMMRLLFSNQPLDHVLATTFTRKAAGEILHRVLSRVAEAITDENSLKELRAILEPLPVTKKHCEYQLARLCSQLHRFRVCTLDSFYKQLASSFSLELEFPPGWSLVDPFVESQLSDQAIARLFETYGRTELRTLVGMLFKGDSGRSVQGQIRSVVNDGYKLYRSTDAEAWVALEMPIPPSESKIEEALKLLGKAKFNHKSADEGVIKLVQKVLDAKWEEVLKSKLVMNTIDDIPLYYSKPIESDLAEAIKLLGRLAFCHEVRLRIEQTKAAYKLLHAYHEQLEIAKRQSRAASFEDIAFRLSRWIAKRIRRPTQKVPVEVDEHSLSTETIDFRMDSRVDHLLLDEFQDTSPQQWDIIRPFAETIARESLLKGNSFFCVGDTKQAIYGWRGGVAQIFDSVSKQIDGVQELSLSQSYRSSPRIMEFVNLIFENLDKHTNYGDVKTVTKNWMARFPRHETAKKALPGYVVLKNGPVKTKDGDEIGGTLMEMAADEIAALSQSAPHATIGVLVKTNDNVGKMIHLLRERKIDASQEGGNPLSDSAAVELILSLIHLADHPGDRVAAFHLKESPLEDRLELNPWVAPDRLAERVRSRITQDGYGPTIAYYCGLLAPDCNARDQQRLEQLIQLAYSYEANATIRVRDFVLFVRETKVALPRPSQVRVMNIHQSKGLEFDAVFLTDLDKGLVGQPQNYLARYEDRTERPTGVIRHCNKELRRFFSKEWNRVFEDYAEQQLYESMCVFYVALTRARKALYLYTSPGKNPTQDWGSVLHSILVANPEERGQSNRVLYALGDEQWYRVDSAESIVEEATTTEEESEPEVELRVPLQSPEVGQQSRLRPTSKPSAAGEPRLVSLKAALEPSESIGAIIGTLVHRWFEEVGWLEDFAWDRAKMRDLALRTLAPQDMLQVDLDSLLSDMERMLSMESVHRALSRERYAAWRTSGVDSVSVDNEVRLLEIMDGYLLRGTIDRLVLGKKDGKVVQAEILDYKTDSTDRGVSIESWIRERADHHRTQLELYRRVLCQQYKIETKDIRLTLILLSADHLESLE